MNEFYGPPYDFRSTPTGTLWFNYYTNPFIDSVEKLELGQWLNGSPPTYGEWYYQYAERVGLENEGATTQPNPETSTTALMLSELSKFRSLLVIGLVVYGLLQLPKSK